MIRNWAETVAVVTGGASGIGFEMARQFAGRGARVMLADIDEAALEEALHTLRGNGAQAHAVFCDVSLSEDVDRAARETLEIFGSVDLVCNNAGVARGGPAEELLAEDYRWLVDVNLMGVVHGTRAFLPHLKAQGRGHILNTASAAGLISVAGMGAYCMTKAAVVAFSECLSLELAETGVGVSVFCPGFIKTRLHECDRARPARLGGPKAGTGQSAEVLDMTRELIEAGLDVEVAGERVVEGLERGDLYILTHLDYEPAVIARHDGVLRAFAGWRARHPEGDERPKMDNDPFIGSGG